MWSAPRDTRVPQVQWVLRGWLESQGSLDIQAHRELESQACQVLLVNRVVQRETREMKDLREKMDRQEIQDQEDQQGLKEIRVTHVKCAPCCLQTWATQWLCKGSQALKENLDYQE